VIWIGQIQWMLANGFAYERDPILRPLENIECRDAILDLSDPENPQEPSWPAADVIIATPPSTTADRSTTSTSTPSPAPAA
jgi:hypothetical protein